MMRDLRSALDTVADAVAGLLVILHDSVKAQIHRVRSRHSDRIEAELDRKQEELRATVLQLADALGADAHEASRALIRESFLARGEDPDVTSRLGHGANRY